MDSSLILKVSNFRCHSDYSLCLKPGQIYLLSGDSGRGKTTLFQAIYWCLYGKATRVAPFKAAAKTVTSVEIDLKTSKLQLKLIRSNNPKSFKLIHDGIVLDGTTAQDFIDDLFGNDNFWLSTSYLRQKGFNPLIKGTNGEKRKLLDRITFGDEHPDEFIEKCDKLLTSVIVQKNEVQKFFDSELQKYQRDIQESGIPVSKIEEGLPTKICGVNIQEIPQIYSELTREISELQEKLKISIPLVNRYNELSKYLDTNITALNEEIQKLSEKEIIIQKQELRSSLISQLNILNETRKNISLRLEKLEKIEKHDIKSLQPIDYSYADINKTEKIEIEYQKNMEKLEKLGIDYNLSQIEKKKREINDEIKALENNRRKYEDYQRNLKSIDLYRSKISDLKSKYVTVNISILEEIKQKIKEYSQLLNDSHSLEYERYNQITQMLKIPLLICPHCDNSVRICENQLVKTEKYDPKQLYSELESINKRRFESSQIYNAELNNYTNLLKNETSKLQHNTQLDAEIEFYQKGLTEITKNIGTEVFKIDENKLRLLQDKRSELNNIEYINKPEISSEYMKLCKNEYEKKNILQELKTVDDKIKETTSKLEEIPLIGIDISRKEISDKKLNIQETIKYATEILSLKDNSNILEYPGNLTKYQEKNQNKIEIEKEWKILLKLKSILEKRDELIRVRDNLINYQNREKKLVELKESLINVQHAKYAMSTNLINSYLAEIVSKLYTKPISVQLRMFKIIKKGNRIKPNINLHVMLENEEIDTNEISGGEYDRLSIALTLALSKAISVENSAVFKINHSPMLLLDESFSALPANDRDRTIETIVSHGKDKDKYILCIAPNSSSNWYEEEITI